MSDRELLELAANAAGIRLGGTIYQDGSWSPSVEQSFNPSSGIGGGLSSTGWNPLDDDGDALRLAVKLSLFDVKIEKMASLIAAEVNYDMEPLEAIRRAIVFTAAEIGKVKK